ncbi:MAG: hypothetical protein IPL35_12960 [Sphingobacteriales bacterium]|nr:hypothetical protein [Sphingobacteriales bacterium]
MRGLDIDAFRTLYETNNGVISQTQVSESLLKWPGKNNPYFDQYYDFSLPEDKDLAPFFDRDGDDIYDPVNDGDYPVLDSEVEGVYADQMIWWVFNDRGNVHSETGGEAIGLEVGALAFAFSTSDEINNMTFYKYDVKNLSTTPINDVYFGQWVDPDLGNHLDDFVGCDTLTSLGIVYNGDANDEGAQGYGDTPPMLGVDFFRGPKDENGKELGMSSFLYYNNNFEVTGNPETAVHFYGYLSGFWKDKTPFTYGGNGKNGTEPFAYMFPTDPGTPAGDNVWSECSEGNEPADRRFLQSSGPFILKPGARNDIIVGVIWVRDGLQHPCPSFDILKTADLKAQALFNSNFKLKDGPDAPSMSIRELDKELILTINNPVGSNNYNEAYQETDAVLAGQGNPDSTYNFQGYRIYQLRSASVTPDQYSNGAFAKEIFTVDIKDGVKKLINIYYNSSTQADDEKIMVEGTDNGIQHIFKVNKDEFAQGSSVLINHKEYYYAVVAYGYNSVSTQPYLEGRKGADRIYTAVPHIPDPEYGGVAINSTFNDGPEVTTISGFGNGGNVLELTDASIAEILTNNFIAQPTYQGGSGPIDVRIYDPLRVPSADFELHIDNQVYVNYTQPKYGTLQQNADGSFLYTPNAGINTDEVKGDYFTYEIANQFGTLERAAVTIQLATGFVGAKAYDDTEILYIDKTNDAVGEQPARRDVDVLLNDYPFGSDELEIVSVTNGARGTTQVLPNKKIRYTRKDEYAGYFGFDRFTYTMKNATGAISTATVTINLIDVRVPSDPETTKEDFKINAADDFFIVAGLQPTTINPLENDLNALFGSSSLNPYSTWELTNLTTGEVYDYNTPINVPNEQAIGGWEYDSTKSDFQLNFNPLGFIVDVTQVPNPDEGNAYLTSSIDFTNVQSRWLSFIADQEGVGFLGTRNWIRSGDKKDKDQAGGIDPTFSDYYDYDGSAYYATILDGGFAPYCLTANTRPEDVVRYNTQVLELDGSFLNYQVMSPACSDCYGYNSGSNVPKKPTNTLGDLRSVDIIMTDNPALWTQCVVIEMGRDEENNIGGVQKNGMRASNSLNKDGSQNTAETGRSWFPGYAIDVESGQRLNIMFSENSFMPGENGADMMFNPTNVQETTNSGISGANYRMGGEHFIYIMNTRYDGGAATHDLFSQGTTAAKKQVYDQVMWAGATILQEGEFRYKSMAEGLIPSGVKMKLRVARSYESQDGTALHIISAPKV